MDPLALLEKTPVFRPLSTRARDALSRAAAPRSASRGALLWRAGEPPDTLHVIQSGLVKLVRTLPNGRSSILGLFGPRDTLGETAILSGTPYYADGVVATASATLLGIPRGAVLEAVHAEPALALALAGGMRRQLGQLETKVRILSAGSVECRIAALLLDLYDRFGDDFDDGTSRVPLGLSRRELADLVATSFETAIRVMTRWERSRLVSTEPDGFTLRDRDALERIAVAVRTGSGPRGSLAAAS
jgi:CRP/FNR family transcriptional regulator